MRYLYLLIAVCSLGMLGVLHKVADHRRCRPTAINLFLFLWAGVLLAGVSWIRYGPAAFIVPMPALLVAAACGTCATLAILNFQHGVRYGKISTSWLLINLSTAVPTVLSIVLYSEHVDVKRAFGLVLAIVALILLWYERRQEELAGRENHGAHSGAQTSPIRASEET